MFRNLFKKKKNDLITRCSAYLESGPPQHMTDYVSGSLTELIIDHGANRKKLAPELLEMASIILDESKSIQKIEDTEIREYLLQGFELVQEILKNQ
ncbi:MAG: hypothetical protein AAF487_05350 [Bacteroidota bacterium]